jgi:hypothetical protein
LNAANIKLAEQTDKGKKNVNKSRLQGMRN